MANFIDVWSQNDFYNFFIYSNNGSLIYKNTTDENIDSSIQGILQAIYFTGDDYNFKLRTLSTDYGLLGFKSYDSEKYSNKKKIIQTQNNKSILFCLVFTNFFGDEDLSDFIMERIFDYLFDILIIHIGAIDLFSTSPQEIEKLKKQLDLFQPSIDYILKNFSNLDLLFKSEKKLEITKEILYPIKHYLETMKNSMKLDFICLLNNDSIVWASKSWYLN